MDFTARAAGNEWSRKGRKFREKRTRAFSVTQDLNMFWTATLVGEKRRGRGKQGKKGTKISRALYKSD